MKKEEIVNTKIQKIAIGTDELFSIFYEKKYDNYNNLVRNSNYKIYTTIMNIAELFHRIHDKNKFEKIYNEIKKFIIIEKYYLDDNFEEEYVKEYENNNIFSFTLLKFCNHNNITNIIM
ncbi:MAG: hypothetical protein IKM97_00040 [Clostridia bacterium]|nr:hypothetical protein [Clostridia bacterium]